MNADSSNTREGRRPVRVIRRMAVALRWVLLALLTLWAVAALWFDVRISWLRLPLAVIYGLGMLVVWVRVRRPWKALVTAGGFVLVLAWWFSLKPSNDRDWQPDVAVLPYADSSSRHELRSRKSTCCKSWSSRPSGNKSFCAASSSGNSGTCDNAAACVMPASAGSGL